MSKDLSYLEVINRYEIHLRRTGTVVVGVGKTSKGPNSHFYWVSFTKFDSTSHVIQDLDTFVSRRDLLPHHPGSSSPNFSKPLTFFPFPVLVYFLLFVCPSVLVLLSKEFPVNSLGFLPIYFGIVDDVCVGGKFLSPGIGRKRWTTDNIRLNTGDYSIQLRDWVSWSLIL